MAEVATDVLMEQLQDMDLLALSGNLLCIQLGIHFQRSSYNSCLAHSVSLADERCPPPSWPRNVRDRRSKLKLSLFPFQAFRHLHSITISLNLMYVCALLESARVRCECAHPTRLYLLSSRIVNAIFIQHGHSMTIACSFNIHIKLPTLNGKFASPTHSAHTHFLFACF